VRPRAQIWSRIEPGAVADAALCRSLPLLDLTRYLTESWVIGRGNFAASIAYPPTTITCETAQALFGSGLIRRALAFYFFGLPGGGVPTPIGPGGAPMCPKAGAG
jgi:hypothetical protein